MGYIHCLASNPRGSCAITFNYLLLGLTTDPECCFLALMGEFWLVGGEGILGINLRSSVVTATKAQMDRFCPHTHTHALEYTHAHTLWDEQTHFPCCPLCSGFLGSRPIHHVPVCRGAAIHRLSSLLFFRSRPVSYSVSLPFSLLGSLYFAPPPPSLSSSFYIFDSLPPSLTPSLTLASPREQRGPSHLPCLLLLACMCDAEGSTHSAGFLH